MIETVTARVRRAAHRPVAAIRSSTSPNVSSGKRLSESKPTSKIAGYASRYRPEPSRSRSRQARARRARSEVDGALGRDRRLPLRSDPAARRGLSRSTRRRRRSAARCTSATSSRTRTPTSSRASSACAARPCSIRWDGTTTGCRPSGACRTTSASAAIRRCRTTRRSSRRTSRASSRSRCRGRTSSSCARG